MEYQIKQLWIKNFKSVKDLKIECSKINLLIGEPNVGKSNILEALSFYGCSYNRNHEKFMSDFIRYESFVDLFYDHNISDRISFISNLGSIFINYNYEKAIFKLQNIESEYVDTIVSENELKNSNKVIDTVEIRENGLSVFNYKTFSLSNAKKYKFTSTSIDNTNDGLSLFPPYGSNLFRTIQTHAELREEIANLLEANGLRLQLNTVQKSIEIVKIKGNVSYTLPYIALADTLRRIIFYYAAIMSNKESILLFEEPESHFFPPYIRDLAFKIIDDAENQYFIATHSPQLFNTLVEKTPKEDLAVFATYYENDETKIHKMEEEELSELLDYGVNVFSNLSKYTHENRTANIG
ncbi:MAG: AAA family ATPase [Bacteroidota bacterium]